MKRAALFLLPAALTSLAAAQAPKPATAPARRPATATSSKLPPNIPVVHGIVKTAFALRYEDFKIGTGKAAEPGQIYKVHYTGWLASDGKKFDSSFDHRRPVLDGDGQPEKNADGTPKLGDPEPIQFPQGRHGVIPGWDQGFAGMKVGGKRRLFIPYQLAYGEQGRPPVIPPKSNLIFDIELVDATELPTAPQGSTMPMRPKAPMPGARPGNAPGAAAPPTGQPATQPTTPPPATPSKPTDPTQPTAAPNSAPAPKNPPPPPTANPTAPPDKPANPEQPR